MLHVGATCQSPLPPRGTGPPFTSRKKLQGKTVFVVLNVFLINKNNMLKISLVKLVVCSNKDSKLPKIEKYFYLPAWRDSVVCSSVLQCMILLKYVLLLLIFQGEGALLLNAAQGPTCLNPVMALALALRPIFSLGRGLQEQEALRMFRKFVTVAAQPALAHKYFAILVRCFWPTVLSVAPLSQHVVCLSVCLSSVTFCILAKRLDRFA